MALVSADNGKCAAAFADSADEEESMVTINRLHCRQPYKSDDVE